MRNLVILSLLLLKYSCSIAQEFKMDVSYNYLYSNQWNKAIQTYNFSRPFIAEKQPLLIHGLNTSSSYIFKSTKNLKHGINVSYSYFRSSAENENFNNILNLHFINLGYILHYDNTEKWKGLYTDLIISAKSSWLFRTVNGKPFVYDETNSKAIGIGGDVCLKAGYYLKLKSKFYLSPFISIGYSPYLYSPNSEAVINQTKGLASKNWTGIFTTQVGLTFHIINQKND
ncbi:MAG: hypothetical protein WCH52_00595 [Bacteroidota bacterium]